MRGSSTLPSGGTCRRPPPEDDLYTNLSQMGASSRLDCDSGDKGYPPAGTVATIFPQKSAAGIRAARARTRRTGRFSVKSARTAARNDIRIAFSSRGASP
jgi:hypothetical protein